MTFLLALWVWRMPLADGTLAYIYGSATGVWNVDWITFWGVMLFNTLVITDGRGLALARSFRLADRIDGGAAPCEHRIGSEKLSFWRSSASASELPNPAEEAKRSSGVSHCSDHLRQALGEVRGSHYGDAGR